MTQVKGKMT
jgi:hypothetical protein